VGGVSAFLILGAGCLGAVKEKTDIVRLTLLKDTDRGMTGVTAEEVQGTGGRWMRGIRRS
jgi:hypothetical protein